MTTRPLLTPITLIALPSPKNLNKANNLAQNEPTADTPVIIS